MAKDPETIQDGDAETTKKKSKLPLMLGLVLALLGGGGGFAAVQLGFIGGSEPVEEETVIEEAEKLPEIAFVALDPLIVNLPSSSASTHLRFSAQLEVNPAYVDEVADLKPRVIDILNGYLRSVDVADLEDPTSLSRLRAQMLRRVQIVVGDGRVRDVLIIEFVLN